MSQFKDSIKIVTIDQNYMRALYNTCNQVYYCSPLDDNKPYIGILIFQNGREYAIPFTSAKAVHSSWPYYSDGKMLVYEKINTIFTNAIYKTDENGDKMHILSVLMICKMIPIKENLYSIVNTVIDSSDDIEVQKYKNLLDKELAFCVSNKEIIVKRANDIYERQMKAKKVFKNCCDFKKLENVCDNYQ